jgi:hypothetical protein
MSKFAAALRKKTGAPMHAAPKPAPKTAETGRSGAREGAKHIGGYFIPPVSKQLRSLAVAEDTTVQDLLAEALNMLFQSRGLPMIAAIARGQATSLTSHKPLELETASEDGE